MFLKTSRYYKQKVVEVKTKNKTGAKAVTLRRLPSTSGTPVEVKGNHRLDIIAQYQYDDPGKFWHIADANNELQANDLVEQTGRMISVPEK
jgi:hypothetical protein